MKTVLVTAAALIAISASNVQSSTTNLINFGDSLSDSGNVQALTLGAGGTWPSDVYPNGQFTNGDTWATQLGQTPSLLGGTNFSYGGARAIRNDDASPDLKAQIKAFRKSGIEVDQNTVATIWIGGNDFLALPPDVSQKTALKKISKVINKVSWGVQRLYKNGVSNVLVLGLPDFGLLPNNAGNPEVAATLSGLTAAYNSGLASAVSALNAGLPGSDVRYFDTNSLFQNVISQVPPELISVPCLADPVGCAANPDNYVFYDDIHPSEWVHTLLAEAIAEETGVSVSAVPLPATAPLMLFGLGGAFLVLHRRKSRA